MGGAGAKATPRPLDNWYRDNWYRDNWYRRQGAAARGASAVKGGKPEIAGRNPAAAAAIRCGNYLIPRRSPIFKSYQNSKD